MTGDANFDEAKGNDLFLTKCHEKYGFDGTFPPIPSALFLPWQLNFPYSTHPSSEAERLYPLLPKQNNAFVGQHPHSTQTYNPQDNPFFVHAFLKPEDDNPDLPLGSHADPPPYPPPT